MVVERDTKPTSIRDRVAFQIEIQQGEVDRLTAQVKTALPEAKAKLDALKALAGEITPEFEALAQRLDAVNVLEIA